MPQDPNNPYGNPNVGPSGTGAAWKPPPGWTPPPPPAPGVPQRAGQEDADYFASVYQPQNGVGGGQGSSASSGFTGSTGEYYQPDQIGILGIDANYLPGGSQNPGTQGAGGSAAGAAPAAAPFAYNPNFDMNTPQVDETTGADIAGQLMNPNTRGTAWQSANPQAFAAPGQGEQYWNQVAGNFNNRPVASNMAASAYNNYESQRNELGALPGLDPYYDRARERTAGDLNRQLAARGGYNTSRGLNMLSDASQGLTAEQANREADYALKRSQNAMNWAQGGAQAAQGADNSSLNQGKLDLAQTMGFGDLAMGAQDAEQNRLLTDLGVNMGLDAQQMGRMGGALDASSVSGGARRDRIMDVFNSMFNMGNATSGVAGQSFEDMMKSLLELEDGTAAAELGGDANAVGNEMSGRQEGQAGIGNAFELIPKLVGMGG